MRDLTKVEKDLLEVSSKKLIEYLEDEQDVVHFKELAFCYYSKKTKEEFQVQIIVTRNTSDFLDVFQVEEMKSYN